MTNRWSWAARRRLPTGLRKKLMANAELHKAPPRAWRYMAGPQKLNKESCSNTAAAVSPVPLYRRLAPMLADASLQLVLALPALLSHTLHRSISSTQSRLRVLLQAIRAVVCEGITAITDAAFTRKAGAVVQYMGCAGTVVQYIVQYMGCAGRGIAGKAAAVCRAVRGVRSAKFCIRWSSGAGHVVAGGEKMKGRSRVREAEGKLPAPRKGAKCGGDQMVSVVSQEEDVRGPETPTGRTNRDSAAHPMPTDADDDISLTQLMSLLCPPERKPNPNPRPISRATRTDAAVQQGTEDMSSQKAAASPNQNANQWKESCVPSKGPRTPRHNEGWQNGRVDGSLGASPSSSTPATPEPKLDGRRTRRIRSNTPPNSTNTSLLTKAQDTNQPAASPRVTGRSIPVEQHRDKRTKGNGTGAVDRQCKPAATITTQRLPIEVAHREAKGPSCITGDINQSMAFRAVAAGHPDTATHIGSRSCEGEFDSRPQHSRNLPYPRPVRPTALPLSPSDFDDIPDELCCPITTDIMTQPVIATDGFTYERHAIQEWLSKSDMSPMTNQQLSGKNLVPNRSIQALIQQYLSDRKQFT